MEEKKKFSDLSKFSISFGHNFGISYNMFYKLKLFNLLNTGKTQQVKGGFLLQSVLCPTAKQCLSYHNTSLRNCTMLLFDMFF